LISSSCARFFCRNPKISLKRQVSAHREPPRRVDVLGVEHLGLVVDRDLHLVVSHVGLDEHLGDVELHRVERGVEHLLRIDATRIDVAILDPQERHVEDLERGQLVLLLDLTAGSRTDLLRVELERDHSFGRLSDDGEDQGECSGPYHQGQIQPAAHIQRL
jgi:hypothetical protein